MVHWPKIVIMYLCMQYALYFRNLTFVSDVNYYSCWAGPNRNSYPLSWSQRFSEIYRKVCSEHGICRIYEVIFSSFTFTWRRYNINIRQWTRNNYIWHFKALVFVSQLIIANRTTVKVLKIYTSVWSSPSNQSLKTHKLYVLNGKCSQSCEINILCIII